MRMTIAVPGLPSLTWNNGVGSAQMTPEGSLLVSAAPGSDWINDALGGPQQHAAALLGFTPTEEFSFSARVRVDGARTTFDAAVLAVWGDHDHWAKLCFEFSPQSQAMVVSVVTNDFSDDCNSAIVLDEQVFLRVIRTGPGWAFHSSRDGITWDFVRVFRLAFAGRVSVGFVAQAPMGETCVAEFDRIEYRSVVPTDLRNGT